MLVIYATKTGNVKRFVDKLEDMRTLNIKDIQQVNEPYVLICYTTGMGQVPIEVQEFLENETNRSLLRGVASSGNKNWANNYAKSADTISQKYNVPVLLKFELSGTKNDVILMKERVINCLGN